MIRAGGTTTLPGSNPLLDGLSPALYRGFCRRVNRYGRRFRVTAGCTRFGLCARVCPVGNIALDPEGRPRWGRRCEACLACYAWCPARAVHLGWLGRSIPVAPHPDIKAQDLVGQTGKVMGWYRRSPRPYLEMRRLVLESGKVVTSYVYPLVQFFVYAGMVLGAVLLALHFV